MAAFTVLLTGATSGIGLETARALATPDRRLILACRNRSKAETLRQQLLSAQPACQIDLVDLDLASLASVDRAVRKAVDGITKDGHLTDRAQVIRIERAD